MEANQISNPKRKVLNENPNIRMDTPKILSSVQEDQEAKEYIFHLSGDFKRTQNGHVAYPTYSTDNMDIVLDPVTKRRRTIRLLIGVPTLYMDEQDVTDKEATSLRPEIRFVNGIFRVPVDDSLMKDFLMMKNCCGSNPNRDGRTPIYYYLENFEEEDKDAYQNLRLLHEAQGIALDATKDQIIMHGAFLNMRMTNDDGGTLSLPGLRKRYAQMAISDPRHFIDTYNDPKVKTYYLIHSAVKQNVIRIDDRKMKAYWSSGATICALPEKGDAVKHLTDFYYSTNGDNFKELLEGLVSH